MVYSESGARHSNEHLGSEWEGARGEIILQTVLTTLEDYFQDVVGCKFNNKVSDAS